MTFAMPLSTSVINGEAYYNFIDFLIWRYVDIKHMVVLYNWDHGGLGFSTQQYH